MLAATPFFAMFAHGEPAPDHASLGEIRCNAVRNFFLSHKSPLAAKAALFVRVAEKNGLDWRLLPGISMAETSGGKAGNRNNVFGWNSGRTRFKSVDAGIEFVGGRLGASKFSAGTTMDILRRYNPAHGLYPAKVVKFMLQMSGDPVE